MSSTMPLEPAKSPPPGVQSNFVDPPSIQPAIIATLTVELLVSTVSVILRCYAQISLTKKLSWADFWMLLGWAFQIVFVALLFVCLPLGGGHHLWDVTKSEFARIQFFTFIDYILYGCAILGAKISILLQLIGIFVPKGRNVSVSTRWFYWSAVAMIIINVVFYIPHNFLLIFQCKPIAKGWNPKLPGTCLNQFSMLESSAPFNIISDILIFILPLSSIWRLKLPVKTRLQIVSAFAVGLFGCICSGVRLSYSERLTDSGDVTWLVFQNQLWANAEVTAAILIANIIILPRFFRSRRKRSPSYTYSSRSRSRSKSIGLQGGAKGLQRNGPTDLYIELRESSSGTLHDDTELRHPRETPDLEIMRTIEIETVEEEVRLPKPVLARDTQARITTRVASDL